jgi:aquaporin Z
MYSFLTLGQVGSGLKIARRLSRRQDIGRTEVTDRRAPVGFAPIAIGLTLTLIHLVSIPVTNTSVNPARSTGVAFFAGGWALGQLWLFWVAPILGAVIAGASYAVISGERSTVDISGVEGAEPSSGATPA